MKLAFATAAFLACASLAAATAQSTDKPIVKPKPPAKPVVPGVEAKSSPAASTPKLPPDLEVALTPKGQKLAVQQLKTFTAATRSQSATMLLRKTVSLGAGVTTMAISPWNPIGDGIWLSMQGGVWRTGPGVAATIFLPNVTVNPQAVITIRFSAAAGARYMLACDISSPETWDVVIDGRATSFVAEGETSGAAIIPSLPAPAQRVLKLVVQRISVPAAPQQHETFRRCEITAIPG